jgi:pilus assembly protein CpaB
VAGFVNAGSEVAVFLTTQAAAEGEQPFTRLLLEKVQILAVGATTITPPADPTQANPEVFPRATMTIAVTQKQLETLVFAQTQGELYLGLLNDASEVRTSQGTNADNLFN